MTWFTESPFVLTATGLMVCICLLVMFAQSRERRILPFILIAALFTVTPVIADTLIETDKEQLKRKVYEMARCVRMNDVQGLIRYVDQDAKGCRTRIAHEMPTYEFSSCSITGFKGIYFDDPKPGMAKVRFVVHVNVNAPTYSHHGHAQRGVGLTFLKDHEGQWKVCHFSHFAPNDKYKPGSPLQNAY